MFCSYFYHVYEDRKGRCTIRYTLQNITCRYVITRVTAKLNYFKILFKIQYLSSTIISENKSKVKYSLRRTGKQHIEL